MDEGKHLYLISLHDTESKKGGNDVWGNATHAPDDECDTSHSHGELIAFRPMAAPPEDQSARNMTVEEASNWILEHTPTTFQVWKHPLSIGLVLIRFVENAGDELLTWY